MKINITGWITVILCLFLTGCNTSEEAISKDGFRFCVQLPKSIDVDTKASLGEASESIEISNAWIVQYSTENTLLHCKYIATGFTQKQEGYIVEISTAEEGFTLAKSNFYIILNGGADLLQGFSGTKADLLKKTSPMAANTDGSLAITASPTILTAGPTEFNPTGADTEKIVFVSRVYRAFAKLSLSVKFPTSSTDKLDIETATITNIPKNMALFAGGGSNANYPAISDIYINAITLTDVTTNGGKKSIWMPENIRGTGSSLTFQGKNLASNGPGGNLTGCTYLTIKGKYYYDKNQTPPQAPIDVEYRFYLGSNLTNDYNIRRDHHYNLTVNLKGANSADLRVTITNGNVAVFDEVETITNEVDF